MVGGLGFPTEVGLDHLLTGGVLGGDVQELSRREQGLMAECVDESLAGHATGESIDHVSVSDVGELVVSHPTS